MQENNSFRGTTILPIKGECGIKVMLLSQACVIRSVVSIRCAQGSSM